MKRLITSIALGISILLVSSCIRDNAEYDRESGAKFAVKYSVNQIGSENKTRATVGVEPGEDKVNKLHLFFFAADANQNGEFIKCITLDSDLEMDVERKLTDSDITISDAYNIIAIANIDDGLYISGTVDDWVSLWEGYNERQFRENVLASIVSVSRIESEWLPMCGSTTKEAFDNKIEVTLTRVVARLDVISNVGTHELEEASIWNAYYNSSLTGDAVMDYSPTSGLRKKEFYGVKGVTGNSVIGELYTFENQVITPGNGDIHTTCIIVGLNGTGGIRYYRVNIHPNGSPQNLKRNNSYTLTITGVAGDGYDTEEEAYSGKSNELIYTINYWDLDDNGLIVSDMNSILAIPTKTIRIGQEAVTNSYTITTFSTLPNPAPLSIKSAIFQPADGSITATLSNNTLYVDASQLPNGSPDRTGIITLTYADLEASINVIQSASVDKFINITFDEDFTTLLPATRGISSENIFVNASGPWTATLYDANTPLAFSLKSDVWADELTSAEMTGTHRFRVTTWSENDQPEERKAFVLVSLDEDPVNYISVVAISQKPGNDILITPDISYMSFDGAKNVIYPSGGSSTIKVVSGYPIQTVSLSDNTNFEFTTTLNMSTDTEGEITIIPKNENTSGGDYTGVLSVADINTGVLSLNLSQSSLGINFDPATINSLIPETGGETYYVQVKAGTNSVKWSASVTVTGKNGEIVTNHKALIELEDGSQKGETVSAVSTDVRFRVVFPKVYYPNRDKDIKATVTVTIDGSALSGTIEATQQPLKSQGVYAWTSTNGAYGSLNKNSRSGAYNEYFRDRFNSYVPGFTDGKWDVFQASGANNSGNIVPLPVSKYTYIHICNLYLTGDYNWTNINTFMREVDGHLVVMGDAMGTGPVNFLNSSSSPMAGKGVTFSTYNTAGVRSGLNSNVANTRIYKIFTEYGQSPITSARFYQDGTATGANVSSNSTFVPVVTYDDGKAMIAIDPVNRILYWGDCSIFHTSGYMNNGTNVDKFLINLVDYICLAASYGSHFTDMMIDYADNDPNYVAAPWDDVWGSNKWDTSNLK